MAVIHFKGGVPELYVEPERREVARMIEAAAGARMLDIRTKERRGRYVTVFIGEIAFITDKDQM